MTIKTTFLVQTFTIKCKRLVPGDREVLPTESSALKKGEAMTGRMPGTSALKVMADDETGELEGVTIIGQLGEIPGISPRAWAGKGEAAQVVQPPVRGRHLATLHACDLHPLGLRYEANPSAMTVLFARGLVEELSTWWPRRRKGETDWFITKAGEAALRSWLR